MPTPPRLTDADAVLAALQDAALVAKRKRLKAANTAARTPKRVRKSSLSLSAPLTLNWRMPQTSPETWLRALLLAADHYHVTLSFIDGAAGESRMTLSRAEIYGRDNIAKKNKMGAQLRAVVAHLGLCEAWRRGVQWDEARVLKSGWRILRRTLRRWVAHVRRRLRLTRTTVQWSDLTHSYALYEAGLRRSERLLWRTRQRLAPPKHLTKDMTSYGSPTAE